MTEARGGTRGRLAWSCVAAAVTIACLEWDGGVWERVSGPDLHGSFLPQYELAARALLTEHRIPLWNPYELCGLPLLGTGQGAVLYPPVWLLFALFSSRTALQAFYALHVVILAFGAVVYLRRSAVPPWAATIVAPVTVAGLATGLTHSGYDHPSFVACVAWLPWMLLAVEEGARDGIGRWSGLLALAVAAQWLAGYPDFPLDVAVLLGVFALVVAGRRWPHALATVTLGFLLGSALAALQLFPLADAVAESARSDLSLPFAAGRDLFAVASAGDLVRDLASRHGAGVLVLALVGALGGAGRTVSAWLVALGWALFALNRPFVWLYELPPYAGIRFPFGWSGFASVFLACLAARGLATLAARGTRARWIAVVLALLVVAESGRIIVGVPRQLAERAPDLGVLARRAELLAPMLAQRRGLERVLSPSEVLAGSPLRYDLRAPAGWEPSLAPRRIVALLQAAGLGGRGPDRPWQWALVAPHAPLLALLGVGTAVVPAEAAALMERAGFVTVAAAPPGDTVLHAPAIPRARLVHRVEVVADETASFERVVARSLHDATESVVLEASSVAPAVEDAPASADEHVAIVADAPEEIALDVDAAAPALLVLTDTHYRGWEATVDSAPTPILRADHAFRAVPLKTGSHRVTFTYRPQSARIGALVSGAALLVVLALLVRRRSPPAPSRTTTNQNHPAG